MGDESKPGSKYNVRDPESSPLRSSRGVLDDNERQRTTATLVIYVAMITIILVADLSL